MSESGLHLAELVVPRRGVTVVQDDRVDARLALLDAEKDPRVHRAPALELAPHVVAIAHQQFSLFHDRRARRRRQKSERIWRWIRNSVVIAVLAEDPSPGVVVVHAHLSFCETSIQHVER
jgi:hypothetical protein